MTRGAEYEPVIGEIRSTLLACGVPVVSSQTEGGPGQWEINVAPASPIETADNAAILKYVVKLARPASRAARHVHADALPGRRGSGHHLHQSLRATGSERERVRADDDADGPIRSRPMRAYLAGVLEHMADLTAVNLPSVNAYKRSEGLHLRAEPRLLGDRQPHRGGADPTRRGGRARLEIRLGLVGREPVPDPGRNDRAGADGLGRASVPPPPIEGDAYKDGTLELVPTTLGAAVDRFEQSAFCKDVFGELFVETFSVLARRGGGLPEPRHRIGSALGTSSRRDARAPFVPLTRREVGRLSCHLTTRSGGPEACVRDADHELARYLLDLEAVPSVERRRRDGRIPGRVRTLERQLVLDRAVRGRRRARSHRWAAT